MTDRNVAGLDVSAAMTDGLVVRHNVRQEVILTTVDKLELCLIKERDSISSSREWIGAGAFTVSLFTTLVAADFKDAWLKAPVWQAIYVMATGAGLIWTLLLGWKAYKVRGSGGINGLVKRISNS